MKSIVVLFDEKNKYEDEKAFDGKTAVELCNEAAASLGFEVATISEEKNGITNIASLFAVLDTLCKEKAAQNVIFSYADCPFLNKKLSQELLQTHIDYKAEYTFAEGYPLGFAPEVLDSGTIAILSELAKTTAAQTGNKKISRCSIMELIKTDINSFEVETVLAPFDWRLLRLSFDCSKKEKFTGCKNLYSKLNQNEKKETWLCDAAELSKTAAESLDILKTVPGFYNLQLAQKCSGKCSYCPYPKAFKAMENKEAQTAEGYMETKKALSLIENIAEFSREAVIGLSAWGECFNHPDLYIIIEKILSYPGLSVLIEADGNSIPNDFAQKIKELTENAAVRTSEWNKVMIVVSMDGFTEQTCKALRGSHFELAKAVDAVKELEAAVPGCVYPQFVRMNANEAELEGFFRYWNEKTNATKGNFIIQKHNNFAGMLENQEPADLSPLERNVCWHLRRDMTILYNGDVPMCYSCVLENITGNVFEESLEDVWKKTDEELKNHISGKYCKKCGGCDEFYTFNF